MSKVKAGRCKVKRQFNGHCHAPASIRYSLVVRGMSRNAFYACDNCVRWLRKLGFILKEVAA